jgi:hypothetical protein
MTYQRDKHIKLKNTKFLFNSTKKEKEEKKKKNGFLYLLYFLSYFICACYCDCDYCMHQPRAGQPIFIRKMLRISNILPKDWYQDDVELIY